MKIEIIECEYLNEKTPQNETRNTHSHTANLFPPLFVMVTKMKTFIKLAFNDI